MVNRYGVIIVLLVWLVIIYALDKLFNTEKRPEGKDNILIRMSGYKYLYFVVGRKKMIDRMFEINRPHDCLRSYGRSFSIDRML